jgi:HD-like signal output (HDOD) protein
MPADADQDFPQKAAASDSSTRLTFQIAETEENSKIVSLKSKILRSLVELPPMPNIILKAREIMEDPGHASILLGQKTLGELITIAASSQLLSKKLKGYQLNPGDLWKHSLAVALGSRIIAEKKNAEWVEDAFIAGLLHDAGKIILDSYIVERKNEFKKIFKSGQRKFIEAEKEILGFDHAEVMSRAARFWRYPENQTTAIRYHHYPLRSGNSELAFVVHLANFAAKEAGFKSEDLESRPEIDSHALSYLKFKKEELNKIIYEITESVEKLATEFQ